MAAIPRVGEGLLYDPYATFRPSPTSLVLSDDSRELVDASLLRVELDVERDSELPVSDVEFDCDEASLRRDKVDDDDRVFDALDDDCEPVADDDCEPELSVSDVKLDLADDDSEFELLSDDTGTDSFCALRGGSPANKTTTYNATE